MILNVVVMSIVQAAPPLGAIVVATTDPPPVLKTQVGKGVHALPTHVMFS